MKIALGIFIGFFICCVLFIVLAPHSVHEVIDKIHGNSSSNSVSSVVPQDDSGAGVIPSDENVELGQGAKLPPLTDEPKQTKQQYRRAELVLDDELETGSDAPIEGEWAELVLDDELEIGSDAPIEGESLLAPTNEIEMLNWLEVHNYTVADEQGFYHIYWHNLKPVSPKPTAIVVNGDGTVIPQYSSSSHMVASRGSTVFRGNNNTITNNGMTITVSTKYENDSWWIETIRSFVWNPRWDDINDVLSKAKKLRR